MSKTLVEMTAEIIQSQIGSKQLCFSSGGVHEGCSYCYWCPCGIGTSLLQGN